MEVGAGEAAAEEFLAAAVLGGEVMVRASVGVLSDACKENMLNLP